MPHETPGDQDQALGRIVREHIDLVTQNATLPTLLEHLVQGACRLTETKFEDGILRLVEPQPMTLRHDIRGDGKHNLAPGDTIPTNQGVTGWVLAYKQPLIADNVHQHISPPEGIEEAPQYREVNPKTYSEMAVPLLYNEECWGVLNLEHEEGQSPFHKDLLPTIQTLAGLAVITIQRADLQFTNEQHESAFQQLKRTVKSKLEDEAREALRQQDATLAISIEVLKLSPLGERVMPLAFMTTHQKESLPPGPGAMWKDEHRSTWIWKAIEGRKHVRLPRITEQDPPARIAGTQAVLVVPLFDQTGVDPIGAFSIESPHLDHLDRAAAVLQPFWEEVQRMLQGQDSTPLYREVESLLDKGDSSTASQRILSQVVLEARQVSGQAQAGIGAALILIEDGSCFLAPEQTYDYPLQQLPRKLPDEWTIKEASKAIQDVVITQKSVLATAPAGSQDMPIADATTYELAVPILSGGELLGILSLIAVHQGDLAALERRGADFDHVLPRLRESTTHVLSHLREAWKGQTELDLSKRAIARIEEILGTPDVTHVRTLRDDFLRMLLQKAQKQTSSEYVNIMVPLERPLEGPPPKKALQQEQPQGGQKTEEVQIGEEKRRRNEEEERRKNNQMILLLHEPVEQEIIEKKTYFPASEGFTGLAYVTGKPQNIANVHDPQWRERFVPMFAADVQSELAIPTSSGVNRSIVFNLERKRRGLFTSKQQQRATFLAELAGRVYAATEAHLAGSQEITSIQQGLIRIIEEVLNEEEDPHNSILQQHVLETALKLVELNQQDGYASFWEVERTRPELLIRKAALPDERARQQVKPILRAAFAKTQVDEDVHKGPSLVKKADEDQDYHIVPVVHEEKDNYWQVWDKTESELVVPIIDPTRVSRSPLRVLAVLNVESTDPRHFIERHIHLLKALAEATSFALRFLEIYRGLLQLDRIKGYLG